MGGLLIPKALAFISAAGVGVATVLLVTNAGGQADPCFGRGTLLDQFTADDGRAIAECKGGVGQYILLDSEGNVVGETLLYDETKQYVEEHPEVLQGPGPETYQYRFEKPEVPAEALAAARQGCPPDWVTTEIASVKARVCHPPLWDITLHQLGAKLNDKPVDNFIVPPGETVFMTQCLGPAKALAVETPAGLAKLCSSPPQYWGRQWGIVLSNGREVLINIYNEATPADMATALRVAASIEALP